MLKKGRDLKGIELWRICCPSREHNGFVWQEGENVDPLPFAPKDKCSAGGLYFCRLHDLLFYCSSYNQLEQHWIGRISLSDDEPVWDEGGKWKAKRVRWHSVVTVQQFIETKSNAELTMCLLRDHYLLQYQLFRYMPPSLKRHYLKQHPYWFATLPDDLCTNELANMLFDTDPLWLGYIGNPKFIMDRVRKDGMLLQYVRRYNRTPEIINAALRQNPEARKYLTRKELERVGLLEKKPINNH